MADAASLPTDTKYQDPFLQSGFSETLTQQIDVFNTASRGAIRLISRRKHGDFDYRAFFANAGGLVSRQDLTSIAAVDDVALTQEQIISVKLNRRIGPVSWARSAFLKPGLSSEAFRVAAGEQAAVDAMASILNSALLAGVASLDGDDDVFVDGSSDSALTTDHLVDALATFGDRSTRIVAFVMPGKLYFDLVKYQVDPANNGDVVANGRVVAGVPASLGLPIYVTDSPALVDAGASTAAHYALALTADGIVAEETEQEYITLDEVTGGEQIRMRLQGEFGFNLGVKGFTWDVANGGKNPDDTALGTDTNWDAVMASHKDFAGSLIQIGTST